MEAPTRRASFFPDSVSFPHICLRFYLANMFLSNVIGMTAVNGTKAMMDLSSNDPYQNRGLWHSTFVLDKMDDGQLLVSVVQNNTVGSDCK